MQLNLVDTTWDELKTLIAEDDPMRVDYRLKWKDLSVLPNLHNGRAAALMTFPGGSPEDPGTDSRPMTDRAYAQFLGKLKIPHGFATAFSGDLQARMISERNPDVKPDADVFLRARPGSVRAILSGRYGDMRDLAVAEILDKKLPDLGGYAIFRGTVSDHLFTVTLIGREPVFTNGDQYFPIHVIGNSEVGARSFHVTSGICKGACSNGMIFGMQSRTHYRIRHLGSKMQASVIKAMDVSLGNVDKWSDSVGPAITRANEVEIDLEQEDQEAKVIRDLRNRGLTKGFATEVLELAQSMPTDVYGDEFTQGAKITRWHVINAMTHLAQGEDVTEDLRFEIETAAGGLLLARAA